MYEKYVSGEEENVCNGRLPQVVPGARVRLAADWGKLHAGDELVVSHLDGPGLVVSPVNTKDELWIPASLIPNSANSRVWSFRPRKVDHVDSRESLKTTEEKTPVILSSPMSIRAAAGESIRLLVETQNADGAVVTWKKEDRCLKKNDRYQFQQSAGFIYLQITGCRASDSGIYHCHVKCDTGFCSTKIALFVIGGRSGTMVRVLRSSRVEIDWEKDEIGSASCSIECRTLPSQQWVPILKQANEPPSVLDMPADASYSFRVIGEGGTTTLPSSVVTLSNANDEWEAKQFVGRYLELDELGNGRFGTVRRAKDRGTGQEVALKQTPRHKQSRSLTRAEYDLLAAAHHANIVRAFALFENAPRPGVDTIVLELVKGPTLFAYLSEKTEYTEATAARYTAQLLSALHWLHCRDRAHLDVKPENVLIDQEVDAVKVIDLGEAVRAPVDEVVPPADLEFAPPESVLGRPTGSYTDMWAVGVFIYVLLSGLSPFLDDSVEETTANILKCDFCFPDEYFETISDDAKELLKRLLCLRGEDRINAEVCLASTWLSKVSSGAIIPSTRMAAFIERRAHCLKLRQDHNDSFYS